MTISSNYTEGQIITSTLAAANAVLTALQNNQTPDLNSLDKWNDALVRYVFATLSLHTEGQDLENLARLLNKQFLNQFGNPIQTVTTYITNLTAYATAITSQNSHIVWEPPFDAATFPPILD